MASTLTPSQAIRSVPQRPSGESNGNTNPDNTPNNAPAAGGGGKPNNRRRNRNRNNNKNKKKENTPPVDGAAAEASEKEPKENNAAKKKNKPRNNKKKGNNNNNNKQGEENQKGNEQPANNNPQQKKKKNNRNKNKKNNNKRFPWRKLIPEDAVDPITLEDLNKLPYPPFALRAAGPYLPPPVWPPVEEKKGNNNNNQHKEEDAKERERRLLQEQWGKTAGLEEEEDSKLPAAEATAEAVNPKHLNLFDGRALAYYMVSQLQFIDPLNRRDLTRDELIHLDQYLRRHNFRDLNVVEAYDTKGVSLSSAGAASTTAAGRAEILQQEARVLLNALFGGNNALPAASNNNNNSGNALMQQYSNYQAAQEQQQHRPAVPPRAQANNNHRNFSEDAEMGRGIYGDEDGGMMVIDDDLNPSMRGVASTDHVRPYASQQPTLWAAGHIAGNSNASNLQPQNFPALSTAATLPPSHSHLNSSAPAFVPPGSATASTPAQPARPKAAPKPKNKKPLPPAKSLNFITKSIKKTTPEETQRQFEAREEARRKAMLSNLTFGSNPASWAAADMPTAPSSMPAPTEGQLERNRNLADAFGLTNPRPTTTTSWARPTEINVSQVVLYPDELILRAREKMGVIIKLEKKWKAFLQDEKAASLPLNHMDRDTRALTHEYSDFWKLNTESFDAEPKRYIHCVKLLDTQMPYPLLSDAARDWRGPTGYSHLPLPEHPASQQTAGQGTRGTVAVVAELHSNPRAAALTSERPKLELKERTLPTELPPFQPPVANNLLEIEEESEEQKRRRREKMEAQKEREREREERKQKALEAAFASDDEEESLGEVDADSDWEEGEALYNGSDDEEEEEEE